MGALRAEVSSSTAAAVVATSWCSGAKRRATTAARRLPRPMSARISRELAPVLRASFCQAGSSVAGSGMCSSCMAWPSRRSPKATDSSYLTVRR